MNKIISKYRKKYMPAWHRLREMIWRIKWFKKNREPKGFIGLISTVDGRMWHGGLCDRFKGIVSTYSFCKKHDIPFRIKYTFPFNLADYLIPNKYDWTLRDNEFSENYFNAEILNLVGEDSAKRYRMSDTRQIHVYANRDYLKQLDEKEDWGTLFKELFKPSEKLEGALGALDFGEYIALVFRFQNLIGDFQEYSFQPADPDKREEILKICEKAVDKAIEENQNYNILVTSDSKTFLDRIKDKPRVKLIPGEVIHIDTKGNNDKDDSYLKSFLDFFMIAGAKRVYGVGTKEMYPSQFPMYAAKVNGIPFIRMTL